MAVQLREHRADARHPRWLPNTDDGEEGDAKGREEGDELPEAVQKVLALAAENDDGDGETSWEEFLELMQSMFHDE